MKNALAAVLVSVALSACQFGNPIAASRPVVGTLQVIVHDEQGQPLPGATVIGSVLEAMTTDRTGIATMRAYAPASSLSVHLPGYHDVFVAQVAIPQSSPLRIVLKRR